MSVPFIEERQACPCVIPFIIAMYPPRLTFVSQLEKEASLLFRPAVDRTVFVVFIFWKRKVDGTIDVIDFWR